MPPHHGKKLFLELVGIALAGLVLLVAVSLWRLSQGPFTANFLTPFVESALRRQSGMVVHVDTITMEWKGRHAPFEISLTRIKAEKDDGTHRQQALIDQSHIQLSSAALLKGKISLLSLSMVHPQFFLEPQALQPNARAHKTDLTQVLAPDKHSALVSWNSVTVSDAEIDFYNAQHETISQVRNGAFQASRDQNGTVSALLTGNIIIAGHSSPATATAHYIPQNGAVSLTAHCDQIGLDTIAALSPVLSKLQGVQLPAAVELAATTDTHLSIRSAHLESRLSAGQIVDDEYFDAPADITGGHIALDYQAEPESLTLSDFTLNLGAAAITTMGTAQTTVGMTTLDITTTITGFPIDDFSKYWPKGISKGGRKWVTENLSKGIVTTGKTHFTAHAPRQELDNVSFDLIQGDFHVDNARVHYFGQLPSVENVAGDVKFDDKAMTITMTQGHIADVALSSGAVVIGGLSASDQDIKIDVQTNGSMATYLSIINRDPLNYAKKLKIDPAGVSGTAGVNLHMAFPLLADVSSDQMQVEAQASLQAVTLPHVIGSDAVENLNGDLDVTTKALQFKGTGSYKDVALAATWLQNFSAQQGVESEATIEGTLTDKDRAALGIAYPDYLSGPVKLSAHYLDKGETKTADVESDLMHADLKIDQVRYEKGSDVPGSATFTLVFDRQGLNRIDAIKVKTGQLDIEGGATFDPDNNQLSHLSLDRLKIGDTNVSATVDMSPDAGTKISVTGSSLDISPLFHKSRADEAAKPAAPSDTRLQFDFDIGHIETSAKSGLDNAKGHLSLIGRKWQAAKLTASAENTPFTFSYLPQFPDPDAPHVLTIDAPDAGKALTALGLTNSMRDGALHVEGAQEISTDEAKQPLTGHAEITNFRLVNTPLLGRLLNLLSLTGLRESFSGRGIVFDIIAIDFEMNDQEIVLHDGRLEGPSIGMTLQGTENRGDGTIDLSGTVVPAYSTNQMINAIPVLGPLLTGGEGQGVFAATYRVTGSFEDPKVSVNPLSVFAPGVLRDLFFERNAPADLPGTPE